MKSHSVEEVSTWLSNELSPQFIDSIGMLKGLLDLACVTGRVALEYRDNQTLALTVGEDTGLVVAERIYGKFRMILSKMGGFYLQQHPDPHCVALYGFKGDYLHNGVVLRIYSKNNRDENPYLLMERAEHSNS